MDALKPRAYELLQPKKVVMEACQEGRISRVYEARMSRYPTS